MRTNRDAIAPIARLGFFAKGLVYVTIGALAAMSAFGSGGGMTGGEGAIKSLAGLPGGTLLLVILAVGLAAYALFRLIEAVRGSGDSGATETAKRVGRGVSAVLHAFLAFTCVQALGLASGGSGGSKKTWLGELLASDKGQWLAIVIGLAVIGAAFYQIYKGIKNEPSESLDTRSMSRTMRTWTVRLGRFGLVARGAVFFIIGAFLIKAGYEANAASAKTTGGALREIASQNYGTLLLALVALGLAAYGVYMIVSARYRRIAI